MPPENGRQVDSAVQRWDNLQLRHDLAHWPRDFTLRRGNHHILATLLAPPSLIEHAERLSDPRRVAQEDFQTPPPFTPFFRLYAAKQLVGIEPAIGSAGH
jgi:hypothetical protein